MAKTTYVARSDFGDIRRTSTREYSFCVVRADGWHQFSQTRQAAEKELRYQQRKGRSVVLVEVAKVEDK